MTSDDFFMSSESDGTPSRSKSHFSGKKGFKASSQAPPEEIVEDHVNQQEVDSVVPIAIQGESIMKRQKLNGIGS